MKKKLLLLVPIVASAWAINTCSSNFKMSKAWTYSPGAYSEDITVENHVLTSVNDKTYPNIRIYADKEVYTIADGAFDDCVFEMIMVSNTVTEVNDEFPTTLKTLFFTGSNEEIHFDIPGSVEVLTYACDEGFMVYWNRYIRPNTNGSSICSVEKDKYLEMKKLRKQK